MKKALEDEYTRCAYFDEMTLVLDFINFTLADAVLFVLTRFPRRLHVRTLKWLECAKNCTEFEERVTRRQCLEGDSEFLQAAGVDRLSQQVRLVFVRNNIKTDMDVYERDRANLRAMRLAAELRQDDTLFQMMCDALN